MTTENELERVKEALEGVIMYYEAHNMESHEPEFCILRDHKLALESLEKYTDRLESEDNKALRMEELEKLLMMIVEKGQLDFNEEGWAFYDKVVGRINTSKVNNKQ